jgi:hypothetical protein
LPWTLISGAAVVPVPWIEKLYGFSSASPLLKLRLALRKPLALGLNCTWKVLFPPAATEEAGWTVTVKSAACVPETVTELTLKGPVPVFWMVKVRVTVPLVTSTLPKSV